MTVHCRCERHNVGGLLALGLVRGPTRSTVAGRRVSALQSALRLQAGLYEQWSVPCGHDAQKVGLLVWQGIPGAD